MSDEPDPRLLAARLELAERQIEELLHDLSITTISLGELAKGLAGNVEFTNPKIGLPELIVEVDQARDRLRAWRHTLAEQKPGA